MGRPKGYDRAEVLRRATALFWDKGYEGTHLQELVEATGVNRFSLYAEFGGKAGLFRAALDDYLAGLGSLMDCLTARPAGLQRVRAYFEALLDFDFRHGCFALNTLREKPLAPEGVIPTIEAFVSAVELEILRNLKAARRRGDLERGADVEGLAKLLVMVDMGLLSYRILSPDSDAHRRAIAQVDRLLHG